MLHWEFKSRLPGLMSLCTTLAEWRKFKAHRALYIKITMCCSWKLTLESLSINLRKSLSKYSITMNKWSRESKSYPVWHGLHWKDVGLLKSVSTVSALSFLSEEFSRWLLEITCYGMIMPFKPVVKEFCFISVSFLNKISSLKSCLAL